MSEKKKEKKGGIPKIVIILIALIVILGGAFGAYMLFFNKTTGTKATNSTVSTTKIVEATLSLNETIINLADTDTPKYVKVIVSFGYDSTNSKLTAEVTDKTAVMTPIFNDAVVKIFRSKKSSDLAGTGSDKVKQQILDTVNPYLQKGQFTNVYFDELVIQ
ncbi:flagellar basal body-associated FliL family protein [Clostridium akagii]|uniref:flagellar basal body-associated FliL family protein n=1 Tax=Clostridium akagii TaxID=91623 RepID=UPI0004793ADF|nr:flagellar basal body-associated FliL family protein [Clostridium akagii]